MSTRGARGRAPLEEEIAEGNSGDTGHARVGEGGAHPLGVVVRTGVGGDRDQDERQSGRLGLRGQRPSRI